MRSARTCLAVIAFAIAVLAVGHALADAPNGAVEKCSTRSEAEFPGAFTSKRNLVVGPLALIGAAYTGPDTVEEFGGNKFPALVRAGRSVTIALSPRVRRGASLGYGRLPQGEVSWRDGHRVVTFTACGKDKDSGSEAGGEPVTFWSGFVFARSPRCVPLKVWIGNRTEPRRVGLQLGRRCDG